MRVQEFRGVGTRFLVVGVLLIMTVVFMGQGGCGTTPTRKEKFPYIFYPSPPDQPRYQFLTFFSSGTDVAGKRRSALADHVLGTRVTDDSSDIKKPYGSTLHDGKLYVCDLKQHIVHVLDLVNRRTSVLGAGPAGKLISPVNIYIDKDGKKYVVDVGWSRVLIYDEQDQYYGVIGEAGKLKPIGLVIMGDDVLILDYLDGEIEVWDKNTQEYKGAFGESIGEKVKLARPIGLTKDDENNLYIVESTGFRIVVYDEEGHFIRSFGKVGDSFGQFSRPKGIAVDRERRVYVVDAAFGNIQVFDSEGVLLTFIEGPGGEDLGPLILPAEVNVDYENVDLFRQYVHPDYELDFLVLVTSQFGPLKVTVYGYVTKKP